MRLSRIEIENFKGIGARQVIELKPITLLFGPNSAGKSTVLQALQYAREVLERGNLDPDTTLSDVSDLGGFRSLVHGRDLSRSIKIRLDMEFGPTRFYDEEFKCLRIGAKGICSPEPRWWKDQIETIEEELPLIGLLNDDSLQNFGLEFEVSWHAEKSRPYVSKWTAFLNGIQASSLVTVLDKFNFSHLSEFNFEHPLFRRGAWDSSENCYVAVAEEPSPLVGFIEPFDAANRESVSPVDWKFTVEFFFPYTLAANPDPFFVTDAEYPDETNQEWNEFVFERIWKEWFFDSSALLKKELGRKVYIGPLREVPTKSYKAAAIPNSRSWAKGLAAWDALLNDDDGVLIQLTNRWLSGEDRLAIPYRVNVRKERIIQIGEAFDTILSGESGDIDFDLLKTLYQQAPVQKTLLLDDLNNRVSVAMNEVGMGISQVLPAIIACCRPTNNLLIVEQPELHLHPAVQVGLGDLFIDAAASKAADWVLEYPIIAYMANPEDVTWQKTLIVETHSEHLLLRLLRRIRETTEGELPPGITSLQATNLSVIYVDSSDAGTTYKRLRVDDEGEFVDRWPKGFFEERAEELF